MALGILEPRDGDPPGTVYVHEEEARIAELLDRDATLHRTKDGKTILVPQPTNDPNDPLTWSIYYRDFILTILCLTAVIATVALALLAANTVTVSINFELGFQWGARLTAWALAGAAVGAWVCVPFARIFGKRALFLFAALLMVASSAWGGSTWNIDGRKKSAQLDWARALQGLAVAPFESLVNTCVGDLYYVHERGVRMAVVNMVLFSGAFMTPIIVGVITDNPSLYWTWSFNFLAIFEGLCFLLLFFFVPETAYRRPSRLNTDFTAQRAFDSTSTLTSDAAPAPDTEKQVEVTKETPVDAAPARKSYWQQLMPFSGRYSDDNFFKLLARPLILFLHPGVFYGAMLQGVIIGWTAMLGVVTSLVFIGPPRFDSERYVGFLYSGAVIGAVLGMVFSGIYSEITTRFMINRNKGKYEPEFRLLLVIPTLITTGIGLFGFGQVTAYTGPSSRLYPGPVVATFIGFVVFSTVCGTIAAAQYILDAHRDISVEAFNTMIIWKNLFSFIITYLSYNWVLTSGVKTMFNAFGGIEVAICVFALPMYVFGKRNRALMHRYDIFKITGLR